MAEHFRTFDNPEMDPLAPTILQPESSPMHSFLVRNGAKMMKKLPGLELIANDIDGQRWKITSGDHPAGMKIHDPDIVIPAMLKHGDVGLFYTYVAGLWEPDTELTVVPPEVYTDNPVPDSLVILGEGLYKAVERLRQVGELAARLAAPFRDPIARRKWSVSTERTKAEIAAHYDIDQRIYVGDTGFLDQEFLQYSAGHVPAGEKFTNLAQAQQWKLDSFFRKLDLGNAETFLEIGSGWGGLAIEAALREEHLKLTSLTVSEEQWKIDQRRAEEFGVADRVTFLLQDYRDFEADRPFDRVGSVEMVEAVAWRDMHVFFDTLVRNVDLKEGIIGLQTINISRESFERQKYNKNFANTAIFPGGFLSSLEKIEEWMQERGFEVDEQTNLTGSYAITLREWIRNLYENKAVLTEIWLAENIPVEDIERFYRGFSFYLAMSQAGFRPVTKNITDWQTSFRPTKIPTAV